MKFSFVNQIEYAFEKLYEIQHSSLSDKQSVMKADAALDCQEIVTFDEEGNATIREEVWRS